MAFSLLNLIWSTDLRGPDKAVLLCLAGFAHDDGSNARPAITTLAGRTGFDRSTVQRSMKALRDAGLIRETKAAKPASYEPAQYRLNLRKIAKRLSEHADLPRLKAEAEKCNAHALEALLNVGAPEPPAAERGDPPATERGGSPPRRRARLPSPHSAATPAAERGRKQQDNQQYNQQASAAPLRYAAAAAARAGGREDQTDLELSESVSGGAEASAIKTPTAAPDRSQGPAEGEAQSLPQAPSPVDSGGVYAGEVTLPATLPARSPHEPATTPEDEPGDLAAALPLSGEIIPPVPEPKASPVASGNPWGDLDLVAALRAPPGRAKAATSRHNEPEDEPPFGAPNVVPLRPPPPGSARPVLTADSPMPEGRNEFNFWISLIAAGHPLEMATDKDAMWALRETGAVEADYRTGIGEALQRGNGDGQRKFVKWNSVCGWVRTAAQNRLAAASPLDQPRGAPPPRYGRKPTQAEIRDANAEVFRRVLERRLRNRARTTGDTGGFE